jgi:hypothetical protein
MNVFCEVLLHLLCASVVLLQLWNLICTLMDIGEAVQRLHAVRRIPFSRPRGKISRELEALIADEALRFFEPYSALKRQYPDWEWRECVSRAEVWCWTMLCGSMRSPSPEEDLFYEAAYEAVKRLHAQGRIPDFRDDHKQFHAGTQAYKRVPQREQQPEAPARHHYGLRERKQG